MPFKPKTEQWWAVYRAIFFALHNRDSDGFEFSPSASRAADAAFSTLGLSGNSSSTPTDKP